MFFQKKTLPQKISTEISRANSACDCEKIILKKMLIKKFLQLIVNFADKTARFKQRNIWILAYDSTELLSINASARWEVLNVKLNLQTYFV